jgi:PhnB protein
VDEIYGIAVEMGAQSLMEPKQKFYGYRVARVKDNWGNIWAIATQTELVSPEEMHKRFDEMMGK